MSGAGKTTVARSLMAAMVRRGLRVQPFKCGPDYIDTKFHTAVCGRPSVNLDLFMATSGHVRALYERYTEDADIAVVEGMMGLFDGYREAEGSTAEVARTLGLPVVMVVDARSAAYSMAALLKGFTTFWEGLEWAGVVFNRVGSDRHAQMLHDVARAVGIPCLGCLPKEPSVAVGERYLGLDFSLLPIKDAAPQTASLHAACRHIAVARDAEAFSFIYQEVLDQLAECGEVTFFNPLRDEPLPPQTDFLYLPGGYPERHLPGLHAATAARESIRRYAEAGGRVVAECGGMMYLCRSITDDSGTYTMCGVLPYDITARTADRRLHLGYRRFVLNGEEMRGHEFHYTRYAGTTPPSAADVSDAKGQRVDTPVIVQQGVLASYIHLSRMPLPAAATTAGDATP